MDRREFLTRAGAATALTIAARNAAVQAVHGLPDVVVIGAGVFGV